MWAKHRNRIFIVEELTNSQYPSDIAIAEKDTN